MTFDKIVKALDVITVIFMFFILLLLGAAGERRGH